MKSFSVYLLFTALFVAIFLAVLNVEYGSFDWIKEYTYKTIPVDEHVKEPEKEPFQEEVHESEKDNLQFQAETLTGQQKFNEAIDAYKQLIKLYPTQTKYYVDLAKVYIYAGRVEEAAQLVNSSPDMDDEVVAQLALLYSLQKNYEKATPLFESYLSKHPEANKVRLQYAEMLSWEKKYPESITQYEIILHNIPDDKQVRRKYGMLLIWMHKYKEGREQLEQTL